MLRAVQEVSGNGTSNTVQPQLVLDLPTRDEWVLGDQFDDVALLAVRELRRGLWLRFVLGRLLSLIALCNAVDGAGRQVVFLPQGSQ